MERERKSEEGKEKEKREVKKDRNSDEWFNV